MCDDAFDRPFEGAALRCRCNASGVARRGRAVRWRSDVVADLSYAPRTLSVEYLNGCRFYVVSDVEAWQADPKLGRVARA